MYQGKYFERELFYVDFEKMITSFVGEKNVCLNKAKKYFKEDKRKSLKNIVHVIRYFLFGIQILEKQKIQDFTCANQYYFDIMKRNYDSLENYFEEFMPIIEKIGKKFLDIAGSMLKKRNQWNKKIGKFTFLEFLKEHPVEDLQHFFKVKIEEGNCAYNISCKELDHVISRECNCLVLSKDKKLLAYSHESLDLNRDYKSLKGKRLSLHTYYFNPEYEFCYYSPEEKIWKTCDETRKVLLKEEFQKDTSKVYINRGGRLSGVFDREKLETVSPDDYKLCGYQEMGGEHSRSIEEILEEIEKSEIGDFYIWDELLDVVYVHHPIKVMIEKIVKKEISQEDGILEIIRNFKLQDHILNYIDMNISYNLSEELQKYSLKYDRLIERVNQELKGDQLEKTGLKDILLELKDKGDLFEYFKSQQVDKLKKFLEIKFKPVSFGFQNCQTLPEEVYEQIISFLPESTVRKMGLLVSKDLQWIRKSPNVIRSIFSRLKNTFTKETFRLCEPYFETSEFQLFSRILPYCEVEIGRTFSLYDHLYLLSPRKLNSKELDLFTLENPDEPQKPKSIVSFSEFLKRYDERFLFSKWKDFINWRKFFIVGGSVLNSVLKDSFETESQDVDIFYYGDYYEFDKYYYKFMKDMEKFEPSENLRDEYYERSRTMYLNIEGKMLTLQFNLYNFDISNHLFFQTLDQDCCQIGFNGKQVLTTYSWIQSINTGTFMNYHLMDYNLLTQHTQNRIEKYIKRGFSFLHPKKYDYKKRELEEIEIEQYRYMEIPFEENNDSLCMVEDYLKYSKVKEPPIRKEPKTKFESYYGPVKNFLSAEVPVHEFFFNEIEEHNQILKNNK